MAATLAPQKRDKKEQLCNVIVSMDKTPMPLGSWVVMHLTVSTSAVLLHTMTGSCVGLSLHETLLLHSRGMLQLHSCCSSALLHTLATVHCTALLLRSHVSAAG